VLVDDIHRLVALGAGAMAVWLYVAAREVGDRRPDLLRMARWILALVAAQVASGLLLVETHIALETTLLHVAMATLLFTEAAQMVFGVLPASRVPAQAGKTQTAVAGP
jgi:heme A synthase